MANDYFSNIELYYSEPEKFSGASVIIDGDDYHHITKVMRHSAGDEIYVTNGCGKIFQSVISSVGKTSAKDGLTASIKKEYSYKNEFANITFCIPKLKNPDRFEFALEKSVELGITKFVIFNSSRTVAKGSKLERWNKIALAAMKQSLRSYIPVISEISSFKDLIKFKGEIILFEQNAERKAGDLKIIQDRKYFFVFGPEGGLETEELNLVNENQIYSLAENRLRTETAIIKFASVIHLLL